MEFVKLSVLALTMLGLISCSKSVDLEYSWREDFKFQSDGVKFSAPKLADALKRCDEYRTALEAQCGCLNGLVVEKVQRQSREYKCRVPRECGLTWRCAE